ncbi:RNA polymerase factor sigma-54 [Qipengyuania sp. 1NDW9]|uniref:RNA polymerase sigma-54 factor n=1 Tax=Qipengyuania xiapuensis TaxID=2867236 RepID=A0ABX8ZVV8_9SPHN|nr:RNA polymerase factor sigma-54 [Qipengyuania xiapuensis]MBX7494137.1 RNA polymerase factor sigma-54 [Qipengyuania xiapuensis]QZD91783.1 RNA polymerase factor sigma-54 [Qipengyuania xiapuensis]
MALGPRLDLRQTQSLVMTPQLQQAIKLLALSNLEIETFVADALESNPLLEIGEVRHEKGEDTGESQPSEHEATPDFDGESALDIAEYARTTDAAPGDSGDWAQTPGSGGAIDGLPDLENRSSDGPSLAEHLSDQIGALSYSPGEAIIANRIVHELDEAGYLHTSLRDLADDLGAPLVEVEDALELVQSLDPTGVGARSLQECLKLQAKEADRYDPCMARLIENLDLLASGDIARLRRLCEVDEEDFADMLAELRGYDPKPGCRYGGESEAAIVPDVLVSPSDGGGWQIRINEASLPRLVVNREYYVELEAGARDKASRAWLNEQLGEADWLIRALDQRQKTILKTASEIVTLQEGFFREGVSAMRPLTLREVAEKIEMHESTVSRVTSNKYLSCPRGTFEMKYFFSSGVAAAGGEGASSEAIKARIRSLCDAEDPKKVLSDQKLADLLNEEGFDLARRTVAKYREAIGIGSSAQRRREKKLRNI